MAKINNRFMRTARRSLELTQAEFAKQLGLTRVSVARYERDGYAVPTIVMLAVEQLLLEAPHRKKK